MRFSLKLLYMNFNAWLLTLLTLMSTLLTQAASDTARKTLFVGSEPRYSVGSSPLFLVDESRPFDLNAYRFCGLMTDSSGNTLPSTTNALGTRICKDGSADCLTKGKRIIYGHLWFPLKTGTYPREPERYCDRFFGRDGGRCQDPDNPGSIEYHSVFLPYQLTLGPVLPTVRQADKSKAIKNLWNTPTGSQLVTLENAQLPSEKFPLIIMNGGDTGKYHEQAVAAQEIAENGYIVVVLDNMGNSTISQVGKYPQFSALNPEVILKAGGVNPVRITSLQDREAGMHGGVVEAKIKDIETLITQFKDKHNSIGKYLYKHIDFDAIGYEGYSMGSIYGQDVVEKIPEIKAGFLPLFFTNLTASAPNSGYYYPLQAVNAAGSVIPGFPEERILPASRAYTVELTKPVLFTQALEDSIISKFDAVFPHSNRQGSSPGVQNLARYHSNGPTFLTFVANADHFALHSGPNGSFYFTDLVNFTRQSVEGNRTYTLIHGNIGPNIMIVESLLFFDAYLKHKLKSLDRLKNIHNTFPMVSVEVFKP